MLLTLCAAAVVVAIVVLWARRASTSARIHLPDRVKLDCVAVDRHQATGAAPLVSAWVFKDVASNGSFIVRGRANMSATSHTQRQMLTVFDNHAWLQDYGSIIFNDDEDDATETAGALDMEHSFWGFPKCADAARLPLAAELKQLLASVTLADVETTSGLATRFGWTCSHAETALLVNSGKKPTLVCVDAEWTHMDVVTHDFHASCAVDTSATLSSLPAVAPAPKSLGCDSGRPPKRRLTITQPCTLTTALDTLKLSEDVLLRFATSWDNVEKVIGDNWGTASSGITALGAQLRRGANPTLRDVPCDHKKLLKKLWDPQLDACWPGPPSLTELVRLGSWDAVQNSLGDKFNTFTDKCVKMLPGKSIRQGNNVSRQDMPLKELFFWMNLWEDATLSALLDSQSVSVAQLLDMNRQKLVDSLLDTHGGAADLVESLQSTTGADYPSDLTTKLQTTWSNDATNGKHLAEDWLRWRVVSEVTAASTVVFVDFVDQNHDTSFGDSNLCNSASSSSACTAFSDTMATYGCNDATMGKLFRRHQLLRKWPLSHTRDKLTELGVNVADIANAGKWGDLPVEALGKLDSYLNNKECERQPDSGVKLKGLPRRMCFTHIASDKWTNQINANNAQPPALLPGDFKSQAAWPDQFTRTGLNGLLPQVKNYAKDHTQSGTAGNYEDAKRDLPSWLVIDELTGQKVVKHMDGDGTYWDTMKQSYLTEYNAVEAKLADNGAEPELNDGDGIYPFSLMKKLKSTCAEPAARRLVSTRKARVLQSVVNMTKLKVAPHASDIPRRGRRGFDAESSSSTTSVRGSACLTFTLSGGTIPAGHGACASHNVVQLVTAATAGLAPLAAAPRHPFDDANVSAATSYSYLYGAHGDDNPSRVVKAAILHRVCAAVDSLVYTGDPNAPPLIVFAHGVANVWLAEALRLNACSLGTGGVWIEMQPAGDRGLRDLGAWGESWCHSLDGAKFTSADDVGMNILGRFCGLIPAEYPARAWATPRQVWLDLMSVRCCGLGVASACHDRAQCLTTCGDVAQAHQFVPASLTQFIRERVNATICSTRSDPTAGATPDTSFDLGLRFPGPTAQAGEASPTWSWCWASQAELEAHGYDWSARLEDRCVVLWHVVPWLCVTRGLRVTSRLSCCLWVQEQVLPRQRHFL